MENKQGKRPSGRPSTGGRKTMRHFRATDQQWEQIASAADIKGLSASAWIRLVLSSAAGRLGVDQPTDRIATRRVKGTDDSGQ